MSWSDFDEFDKVLDKYLPNYGEGETMATQTATAICKLVYKWFNDGDVFDNSSMPAGCNDLSSYANWLWTFLDEYNGQVSKVLERVFVSYVDEDYENLLYDLCACVVDDELLAKLNEQPKQGSVYDCNGLFEINEEEEENW